MQLNPTKELIDENSFKLYSFQLRFNHVENHINWNNLLSIPYSSETEPDRPNLIIWIHFDLISFIQIV